jgi:hypothetical protein
MLLLARNAVGTVTATTQISLVGPPDERGLIGLEANCAQNNVRAATQVTHRAKRFVEEELRTMRSYADEELDEAIEDARGAGENGRRALAECARVTMRH